MAELIDGVLTAIDHPQSAPELPIDVRGTAFQEAVWRELRKIPLGETRSYEDIARATRLHPRQIGWLVAANHLAILIPCHRVVGKDGSLVGYGGGLARKRWLLDHELRTAGVVLR